MVRMQVTYACSGLEHVAASLCECHFVSACTALAKIEAHTKLLYVDSKLPRGSMLMEVSFHTLLLLLTAL